MTETSGSIHWHRSTLIPHRQLTVQFDGQRGQVILKFPGIFPLGTRHRWPPLCWACRAFSPLTHPLLQSKTVSSPFAPSLG